MKATRVARRWRCAAAIALGCPSLAAAQTVDLPGPSGFPLAQVAESDPLINLSRTAVPFADFRSAIADVIDRSPQVGERAAGTVEALAVRREVRSALLPTVDLGLTANRSIARRFSSSADTVLEQSRGNGRADATLGISQLVFDFGAVSRRMAAAAARIEEARADWRAAREAVALRAIGAWYDVFDYRALCRLSESDVVQLRSYRSAVDFRIRQGVSAPIDRARLESVIASAAARHAQLERQRGNAEARYSELFGRQAPATLARIPEPKASDQDRELIMAGAAEASSVKAAEAEARAARSDARALRASLLPQVGAGVDAGRYALFEPGRNDYDVRARVSLRLQLFGPGPARAAQATARAEAARLHADSARGEATREAAIALNDAEQLDRILSAREADYIASRQLRDAEVERFSRTRGTLFDVLDAQERTLSTAATYLQTLSERDTARYVVLARSNMLLGFLRIEENAP